MGRGSASGSSLSEADIRRVVAGRLAAGTTGIARLIVHEYGIAAGRVRADVAELTGDAIHLVEIKSGADTLLRLPRQAELYGRVADRCTLAADPGHLEAAAALLPDWWELVAVDADGPRLHRAGRPNPAPDPVTTAMLLWAPELASAVRAGLMSRRWEDVAPAIGATRFVRHPDPATKRGVRRASRRARRRPGGQRRSP